MQGSCWERALGKGNPQRTRGALFALCRRSDLHHSARTHLDLLRDWSETGRQFSCCISLPVGSTCRKIHPHASARQRTPRHSRPAHHSTYHTHTRSNNTHCPALATHNPSRSFSTFLFVPSPPLPPLSSSLLKKTTSFVSSLRSARAATVSWATKRSRCPSFSPTGMINTKRWPTRCRRRWRHEGTSCG